MSATTGTTATADAVSGATSRTGLPGRWAVLALVAWTAFVWVGRVRNAVADEALDGGERVGPLVLSASFLLLAAVAAVLVALGWNRPVAGRALVAVVGALAAWSTAVWAVRLVDIVGSGDHEIAFVVVHSVLGIGSIALSALALVRVRRQPSPAM